jgi:hypothetical protein
MPKCSTGRSRAGRRLRCTFGSWITRMLIHPHGIPPKSWNESPKQRP